MFRAGRLVIAAIVLTVPVRGEAAPPEGGAEGEAPRSEAERLYYEGSAKYSASDYAGAIESFTASLTAVTRDGGSAEIREALLVNLARSHRRAYALDEDRLHLKTARDIYRRLIDEADEGGYSAELVEDAKKQIAEIDAELAGDESGSETSPETRPEPTPETTPEPADPGPPQPVDRARRNRGIGLLAGGLAGVGGGVGLMVHGFRFAPNAEEQLDMYEDPPEAEKEFRDAEVRKGTIVIASGASLAAVGLGLVIWGAVDLAKSKGGPSKTAARVRPAMGFGHVGVRGAF